MKGKVVSKPIEEPRILQKVVWNRGEKTYVSNIERIDHSDGEELIFVRNPDNWDAKMIKGFRGAFKELFIEEPADLCLKSTSMGTIMHVYHALIDSDWEKAIMKGYVDSNEEVEFFIDAVTGNDHEVAILLGNHTTVTGELVTKEELWEVYNSLDRPYGFDNIWGWMKDSGYVIIKKK